MTLSTITRTHKNSVRVATLLNITLVGLQTIDGITVASGDRVLVKDQTSGTQNGIYIASSNAWVRAPDADRSDEILTGMQVYVSEGTQNGAQLFILSTIAPIVLGQTSLSFTLFSGSSSGGGSGGGGSSSTTVGNPALLDVLQDNTSVYTMYVSADGDDTTGTGALARPWKTIQRAFDEIPDGCNGTAFVQLLGAGPFNEAIPRDFRSPNFLHVMVIGDRSSPAAHGTLSAPATQPSNPNGGFKWAALDYDIGSYATVFSNGSHWCTFESADVFQYGLPAVSPYLMDCINNSSPTLRVLNTADWFGTYGSAPITVTTYPFVSVIENQLLDVDGGASEHFTWLRAPYSHAQRIYYAGCILGPVSTSVNVTNCAIWACLAPLGYFDDSFTMSASIHVNGAGEVVCATQGRNSYFSAGNGGNLSGIFDGGVVDLFNVSGFIGNCIFRNTGTSGYQLVCGTHTNPAPGCSFKLDNCDFEPPGAQNAVLMRHVNLRHGSFGGSSVNENVTNYLRADQHSWAEVEVPVHGGTTGVPFIVDDSSVITGLTSFVGGDPLVHNTSVSGNNVSIGDSVTVDFSDLPQTDLASLSRAE